MKRGIFFITAFFLIFIAGYAQDPEYIVRLIHGRATYSDFGKILLESSYKRDHQKGSFYGVQVEKYLLIDPKEMPIDITAMGSFFWHSQHIEDPDHEYAAPYKLTVEDTQQINAGLKIYWKGFPWSDLVRTRFAVLEGISYTEHILNIERQNSNKNSSRKSTSNFLNYLETSVAFNIGDVLRKGQLETCYLGIGVSHRSGIFGTVNNVYGGSNFITFFVENHF